MRGCTAVALSVVFAGIGCSDVDPSEGCVVDDFDGIAGGDYVFELNVDDSAFTPAILKTQNLSQVRLRLTNSGARLHGFSVRCLPTPNGDGCPLESCFPEASRIAALAAGASATVEFEAPNPEGIYDFYSDQPGDEQAGQFVVQ
jgi:hypothetical protein